jgi:exodeoxyribonuclease VII large subunit
MPTFFSLSRVLQRVDELLRPAMEKTFWVKAEISSSRSKGGHFYCDLVESNEKGTITSQVRCTIWARELQAIKQKFKQERLELALEDGLHIGMLCRLQFHPIYGLSLRGLDMDPAFVLGEMELKKREIIERLQKRGLVDLNKETFLPSLPQKIGLITGESTAAYEDFINTLSSSDHGFKVYFAASTMQGENTALSVLKGLSTLSQLDLDLVVICRGGGSKVDLSWLDHEGIAEHIAHSKIPIWTGIGHEIDTSVLDYVSAQSFKTPTAIAEELVSMHEGMSQWMDQAKHNLKSNWTFKLKETKQTLQNLKQHLRRESLHFIRDEKNELQINLEHLKSNVTQRLIEEKSNLQQTRHELAFKIPQHLKTLRSEILLQALTLKKESLRQFQQQRDSLQQKRNRFHISRFETQLSSHINKWQQSRNRLLKGPVWSRIQQEKEILKSYRQTLRSAAPETQLERGFSLIQDNMGKAFTKAKDLHEGQAIELLFKDGKVKATVNSQKLQQ